MFKALVGAFLLSLASRSPATTLITDTPMDDAGRWSRASDLSPVFAIAAPTSLRFGTANNWLRSRYDDGSLQSPIPEPATWILMAAGVIATGGSLRRGRVTSV